jgi:RNA polymerase sigma-70 factor (ECF subfamily)
MPDATDEEIAMRIHNGDDEAFGELMHRYESRIGSFGRRFISADHDVRDLVQEIFIKAFVNIESFDAGQKFSSWLYRIAHNHFVDALKKKKRERVWFFDLDVFLPHATVRETAVDEAERQQMRELLNAALTTLDIKYRAPLLLYYFDEMGYREISDILRIPVSTVGVRLARGRSILKASIGNSLGGAA